MWKFLLLNYLIFNSIANAERDQKNATNAHSEPLNFAQRDLLFLSEMPLEQLLKVKKSIDEIQQASRQVHHNHNYEPPLDTAAMESRIINDEPMRLELDGGRVQSSAMPLINTNQSPQQLQQQPPPTINRLIKIR
jgi:hypothetical protein